MDIRSFFGGKGAQKKAADSGAVNASTEENVVEATKENPMEKKSIKDNPAQPALENRDKLANYSIKSKDISSIPADLREVITWAHGEPVPYAAVAAAFDKIGANSSRLAKESILSKLYRAVTLTTPEDLVDVVYLTSNKVFPAYEGMELGIGMLR